MAPSMNGTKDTMISSLEASRIINESARDFGVAMVALGDATGRVLREDWFTDRDMPPYDRVAMDGIAIKYAYFESGQRLFIIDGVAPAGQVQITLTQEDRCIEVMTGGVLPNGCDTVIRYEDVSISTGIAMIKLDHINQGQNVHHQGKDHNAGELIVESLSKISSAEIGVGATLGKSKIKVSKLPKVMVISTGDELVPIDQIPLPHQIIV